MLTHFDMEYTIPLDSNPFELTLAIDSEFYHESHVWISIREIVLDYQNIDCNEVLKLICKNDYHPVYYSSSDIRNEYKNLAIFHTRHTVPSHSNKLIIVHSTPMKIPILGRKIAFELRDVIESKIFNFARHCRKGVIRIGIKKV